MINRYEAYRDGVALSSIDGAIMILDIQYPPVSISYRTGRVANRQGVRTYGEYVGETSVTIVFEIHEYDTVKRQAICRRVARWAMYGKYMTTSDRPEERLRCVCDDPPSIQSVKKWTDQIKMTFTAQVLPFWEEVNETRLTITGASGSQSLYIPGNVRGTLVTVSIKANAACENITIASGSTMMMLKGLGLEANDVVLIDYDDNMILRILKNGTTSILSKRSGSDDLLVDSGKFNTFVVSASASVTATFYVRGWSV